jgi:hypothetical protein
VLRQQRGSPGQAPNSRELQAARQSSLARVTPLVSLSREV